MTKANVLIDNDKVKVTEWSFKFGDSTDHHVYECNYNVIPMLDGELKILDKNNIETISKLSKCVPYYRDKREEHNVFNNNNSPYFFIDIELIK